jgi:4-methylaminobutanoate oxidase (formaldehyde-forming)
MGELGWELYIPTEFAPSVYDSVLELGTDFGLKHVGAHAINSLRIEKAYKHWGHDITDEDTPLEAGLGFAVDWEKPIGFIGRAALLRQKDEGVKKILVQLMLEDSEKLLYHNEPIYRNGRIVGYVTSAMYGHTLGGAIGLGYIGNSSVIDNEFVISGSYEVGVVGKKVPATVSLKPIYDPKNQRVKE